MEEFLRMHREFEPPYGHFDSAMLGQDFSDELELVSRLWFRCGYRPGIAAYLNFFLLHDFIVTHDIACPPRFRTFRSMAESFYRTDLFIRDVTDSGRNPTGGISSKSVRQTLEAIMQRHQRLSIPAWMMTYFGFSLLENVEKQFDDLTAEDKYRHLAYMTKTYRIMGIPFSHDRDAMEQFGRRVEEAHAHTSPQLEKHAHNILVLGEMIGVSSRYGSISDMLAPKTRAVLRGVFEKVRPNFLQRVRARVIGRLFMKQAVGEERRAVPANE